MSQQPQNKTIHADRKDAPLLVLKPKFVPALVYLETAIFSLLGIFVLTIGVGVLCVIIISLLQMSRFIPIWVPFTLMFALGCILIPAFVYETIKKNTKSTGYKFYQNYVSFQHFSMLFFRNRGRLKYRDVQSFTERSHILQNAYGVGNVIVLAPGTGVVTGQRFPGLKIRNVELTDQLTAFFEHTIFPQTQWGQQVETSIARQENKRDQQTDDEAPHVNMDETASIDDARLQEKQTHKNQDPKDNAEKS